MQNIRIRINDLTDACIILGDVHVVASGSMYATLACDENMRVTLSEVNIAWQFDHVIDTFEAQW